MMMAAPAGNSPGQNLVQALEVQYSHVEEYCQAQTELHNLLVTRGKERIHAAQIPSGFQELQAVQVLDRANRHVREDLMALQTLMTLYNPQGVQDDDVDGEAVSRVTNRCVKGLLQKHIEMSRRVIQTVRDPLHPNGLPNMTGSTGLQRYQDANMVALAALRASVARVTEAVEA